MNLVMPRSKEVTHARLWLWPLVGAAVFLSGCESVNRKAPSAAAPAISVAMMPAPDLKVARPKGMVTPVFASGTNKSNLALNEAWEEARQQVIALENQTYRKKPLLYVMEHYYETPRQWFETQRGSDAMLLARNAEAVTAMKGLAGMVAEGELLEDARFRVLFDEDMKIIPESVLISLFTEKDNEIGFPQELVKKERREDVKTLNRLQYMRRKLADRTPYFKRALRHQQLEYKVSDEFVSALTVKMAVSGIMQDVDLYVGMNMPPELTEARRKFRQLDIRLAESK